MAWIHTLCHVSNIVNWRDPDNFKHWSWAYPENRHVEEMEGVLRDANGTAVRDELGRLAFDDEEQGDA